MSLRIGLFVLGMACCALANAQEQRVVNGRKFTVHLVTAGQTLYAIAQTHAVPVDILLATNPAAADGLSIGEEVLLFAEPRGEALSAVGMAQGKLHVATEGGRKVVYGSLAGAELVPSAGAARAAAMAGPRPLDDVLREVAVLVQQRAPSKAAAPARGAK